MNIDDSQAMGINRSLSTMKSINKDVQDILSSSKKEESLQNNQRILILKKEKVIEKIIKRFIDIICSLIGILFLLPLTIIIFVANKIMKDKGPIFYVQERIGKGGKTFKMYKYRSMFVGADEDLEKYLRENPKAREEYKINKKLKYDPRVTKVGNFIRKTSIDEFPQFINILKGEMSLVGPRAIVDDEVEKWYIV